MNYNMTAYIILMAVSAAGITGILWHNILKNQKVPNQEMESYIKSTKSVTEEIFVKMENYLIELWKNILRNYLYNSLEKSLLKTRLLAMKTERSLQKITEELRGRKMRASNGQTSEYWKQISKWKNNNGENGAAN